jgi:hypothetical protein
MEIIEASAVVRDFRFRALATLGGFSCLWRHAIPKDFYEFKAQTFVKSREHDLSSYNMPMEPSWHGRYHRFNFLLTLPTRGGARKKEAHTGSVTLFQRFEFVLNLNVHLTCMDALMLWMRECAGTAYKRFLNGVYVRDGIEELAFRRSKDPSVE